MSIKIKRLNDNAIIPTKGSVGSAGWDLYACLDDKVEIPAGKTVKIGTGLAIAIPQGFFGAIFARSGLATKKGLRPANCVGVCDSDYRGEYIVALHNDSDVTQVVEPCERIAQLILLPYCEPLGGSAFEKVDSLDDTERGTGGFGSTGTN